MIDGRVNDNLEAVLSIDLIGSREQRRNLTATIDTGFNGDATLPLDVIAELGFERLGECEVELGNGAMAAMSTWLGTVSWETAERTIVVLAGVGSLVGMSLLEHSRLTLEVQRGGTVRVEPL